MTSASPARNRETRKAGLLFIFLKNVARKGNREACEQQHENAAADRQQNADRGAAGDDGRHHEDGIFPENAAAEFQHLLHQPEHEQTVHHQQCKRHGLILPKSFLRKFTLFTSLS